MKEHPQMLSDDQVRAIRSGGMTQLRLRAGRQGALFPPPSRFAVGDRLWVREAFCPLPYRAADPRCVFRADGAFIGCYRWRPSMHMPRAACRIVLEITDVQVARFCEPSDPNAWFYLLSLRAIEGLNA